MDVPAQYGPAVDQLLAQIRAIGFPTSFLRTLIPDWWTADVEAEPGALTDLKIRLARRLGLELQSLVGTGDVTLALPAVVRYKRAVRLADAGVNRPFVAYCTALAQTVAAAMPSRSASPSSDGDTERDAILADADVAFVSFNSLLRRCWEELDIAVVHISRLPTLSKGFDAASYRVDGRYVIVLAKQSPYPAWASFLLAHELGHIAAGHVGEGEVIVDDEPENPTGPNADETVADMYALATLASSKLVTVGIQGRPTAAALARAAIATGRELHVDPGHLILRFARESGEWELAQLALARMHDDVDVARDINRIALAHLALDDVGEDGRESLVQALSPSR